MQLNPKKVEITLIFLVILVAIFFRFWQIRDYIVFLGDEGRDVIVMRNMVINGQIPFLGPTASVGGFYLGPIYYWMAAPFLALFRFDPVGPAYFVAIVGTLTVFLLYKFLKEAVGFAPAILSSALYATAPLIVRYSRSSWNPNPIPFFSLLLLYFLYLGIAKKKKIYFLLAGFSFGIIIQLHYLATIMLAIAALIIFINSTFRNWLKILLLTLGGTLITFSPFLLFEIKNHFPNFITIREFVTRGTTVGYKTTNFVWLISNLGNIFLEELTKLKGTVFTKIIFWVLTAGGFWGLVRFWKDSQKRLVFSIGIIYFLGALAGLRFYSGQVFDYYFGFMFPAPFFLAGIVISLVWSEKYFKPIVILMVASLFIFFTVNGFYKYPPNKLIQQTQSVTQFTIDKSEGKPFNFALISDHNSDHAYRYFLEIKGHKPTDLETIVTEQLLVICESKNCAPLGHPTWEIAGFGRAEIAGEWELPNIGIKVIRLIHWPGAPSPAGKPAVKGI